MYNKFRNGLLLLLLVICQSCAPEELATKALENNGAYHYLSADSVPLNILEPPFAERSSKWNDEIKQVIIAQKKATEQQKSNAMNEENANVEMVSNIAGSGFSADKFPETFKLLNGTFNDCMAIVKRAKDHWKTRRPYVADSRIKPLVKPLNSGAYPSGHTACGYVTAKVMGELMPSRKLDMLEKAADVSNNRIIAGVHYPQDIKAGKRLATLIMLKLHSKTKYWDALKAGKKELTNYYSN